MAIPIKIMNFNHFETSNGLVVNDSTHCLVLVKSYRGQLWKCKQIKIPKGKIWKNGQCCQTYFNYKIAKRFSYHNKWFIFGAYLV